MTGEVDLAGVFVPALMVWAVIALALGALLRWLLGLAGVYRLVWHAALFDVAGFVILWWGVSAVAGRFGGFGLVR